MPVDQPTSLAVPRVHFQGKWKFPYHTRVHMTSGNPSKKNPHSCSISGQIWQAARIQVPSLCYFFSVEAVQLHSRLNSWHNTDITAKRNQAWSWSLWKIIQIRKQADLHWLSLVPTPKAKFQQKHLHPAEEMSRIAYTQWCKALLNGVPETRSESDRHSQ